MTGLSVVVLAAGQGTRMKSSLPKVLHPLAGWPLIQHVVATVQQLEADHTVVVLGHNLERVRSALPADTLCVPQIPQRGTGHAVRKARSALEGKSRTVLVLYGDTPLVRADTLHRMLDTHNRQDAVASLLTFIPEDSAGYGRILRDGGGNVTGIVEHKEATPEERNIQEANSGILCFRSDWLWPHLDRLTPSPNGEYYLTDLIALAASEGETIGSLIADDPTEVMGINDRSQLAQAEAVVRERLNCALMLSGVTMRDPATTYVDMGVCVARDTVIEPNTTLRGRTVVGTNCVIGPNSVLQDVTVEDNCRVTASVITGTTLYQGTQVGPFECVGADI